MSTFSGDLHPTRSGGPLPFLQAVSWVPTHSNGELRKLERWTPYENCTAPSLLHFPYLGLPNGPEIVVLACLVLVYCFLGLTFLCTCYFLPALNSIAHRINGDVTRASIMAAAASIPELLVSMVGTFFTEADVGASAIVGSAVFNTLAIPALCALVTSRNEKNELDAWALSRDAVAYSLGLFCLVIFFANDTIQWYEALTMVLLYMAYVAGIQIDKYLKRRTVNLYHRLKEDIFENAPLIKIGDTKCYGGKPEYYSSCDEAEAESLEILKSSVKSRCSRSNITNCMMWPFNQVMKYSIPKSSPWATLVMSCVWLALITYITSWTVSLIGYRLGIPDSLLALTVLGIGIGIPELLISLNAAKRGKGTMALCNAVGSNIINTLLCLGLPWLLKMVVTGTDHLNFNTDGLSYSCFQMFCMFTILYVSLALNKFVLDKKIGWLLLFLYIVFFVLSILIETNVFFISNLPLCNIKDYFND